MKPKPLHPQASRHKLSLVLNLGLALLMVLSMAGLPAATRAAPPGQQIVDDPYSQWAGEFFDFATPSPKIQELSQPDSTTFQARLTPMETGGHLETLDSYTILKNDKGWWCFAELGDGSTNPAGKLVPSSLIVGKDAPKGLDKKLGQTPSIWLDAQGNDTREGLFAAIRTVSSPNNSMFTASDPAPKIYRYVVLLVEFQDQKFLPYQTKEWFEQQLSGLGQSPTGSVTDLYYENSHGRFSPYLDVYGPFTSDYNMAAYDYQLTGGHNVGWMINYDIGPKAKDAVQWDQYDNDRVLFSGGSGNPPYRSVDMVVVLHAGPGKEATGVPGQIWSHATNANFRTGQFGEDGSELRIRAVNTSPATGFNIGVVAHEMGHSIGESDYYATSYNSAGTGDWDIMAGGSWMGNDPAGSNPTHFNPFSKVNQRWVEPRVITSTTLGVELRPRSLYGDVIDIPLGGSGTGGTSAIGAEEHIYVENISNSAPGAIFDKAAYGSGLLIWHYDRGGNQNRPARYRMAVEEYDSRDSTQELRLNLNRGEPTDPWSATPIGITPNTTPNTNRNTPLDGTLDSGWHLINISDIGPTMTLDIVRSEDVLPRLAVESPILTGQPVIAGSGPAEIATYVYNQTGSVLSDVQVRFLATIGEQQVLLAETTVPTVAAGTSVLVTATWANPMAGKFAVTAQASAKADVPLVAEMAGTLRVFPRQAPVLIVDDDDGYTAEEAYEGVLTSLGVPYVLVTGTANLATLSQYELVIWSAGQAGRQQGQLNTQEIADLKAYLDAGGKLWMGSPRLAAALGSTGAAPGADPGMLRDYLGTFYPMSSQAGGGIITGLGQPIGGNGSYQLRAFPGRAIQDFLQPATSQIGTVTPLFTWSFGDYLGMEIIGDDAHNRFHVVYLGFNLSQVVSGADRLLLTQQVLDRMGISNIYFDKGTYLMEQAGAVKVTLHHVGASAPQVVVRSEAQSAGVTINLEGTEQPGTFIGTVGVQKTGSQGDGLRVNDVDTLHVSYEDAPGHTIWATTAIKLRVDADQPPTIHHDLIYNATDAQDLPVLAVVTDDIRVQRVDLYFRVAGSGAFTSQRMEDKQRSAYSAVIPASAITPMGVEYYIVASDSKGNVSWCAGEANPQLIAVQPRTLGQ